MVTGTTAGAVVSNTVKTKEWDVSELNSSWADKMTLCVPMSLSDGVPYSFKVVESKFSQSGIRYGCPLVIASLS